MSARTAALVLVAATLVGIVGTMVAGSEPGFLLGFFITTGSVIATFGIRRGAVYLMFPLPAFALFVAAVVTGKIHDGSLTSSTTGLGVGFLQWIAAVFFPMIIATIAVLVAAAIRWLLAYQLVTGQVSTSADRGGAARSARPASRPDRPDGGASGGSRTPADLRSRRPGTPPPGSLPPGAPPPGTLPPGTPRPASDVRPDRPARPPGDQRADRDRWGDPRQQPDPRARDGRPAPSPPAQPGDRAARPPARPSWEPRPRQPGQPPRPARPPGQDPRGPWDQR